MRCPSCGLISPLIALWCDCDYDFRYSQVVAHEKTDLLEGRRCAECGLINAFSATWCFCGLDLRLERGRHPDASGSGALESGRLRLIAYIIDGLIFLVPFLLIFPSSPALGVMTWLGTFVYQLACISTNGQTLGRKALGLRG